MAYLFKTDILTGRSRKTSPNIQQWKVETYISLRNATTMIFENHFYKGEGDFCVTTVMGICMLECRELEGMLHHKNRQW